MSNIDQHLDAVLRAAGSGLRYYSMQKTLDEMRAAMRAAMDTTAEAERKACAELARSEGAYSDQQEMAIQISEAIMRRGMA